MATGGTSSGMNFGEQLHQKKMVVDELLALRRARIAQKKKKPLKPIRNSQSPTTGRVYEAFKVLNESENDAAGMRMNQDHVRELIKGTALEQELNATYGVEGINHAAESYVRTPSRNVSRNNSARHDSKSTNEYLNRRTFFHKLMKERQLRLAAKRERRLNIERELRQKKSDLQSAKVKLLQIDSDRVSMETDSDDEDLNRLIENAKENIIVLERRLRDLKMEELAKKGPPVKRNNPLKIDNAFKLRHGEAVHIAADIVNSVISRALDICVYSEDNLEAKLLEQLLQTDGEAWKRVSKEELKRDAIFQILEEIEREVSSDMIEKVAEEFVLVGQMNRVSAANLVLNSAYMAVHNKPPKDRKMKSIEQKWVDITNRRVTINSWAHTKSGVSKVVPSDTTVNSEPQADTVVDDEVDDDIAMLVYDQTPLTENVFSGEIWEEYIKAEYSYWESNSVTHIPSAFDVPYDKVLGISCLKVSRDNNHIAMGTCHGDIVVYDLRYEPFRPVRCVAFVGRKPERILRISWSLDGSRILSLSDTFCVIVWSISFPSPPAIADIRSLKIADEKDTPYDCYQLTALAILEANMGDFAILEECLSTPIPTPSFSTPLVAVFSQCLTVTGSQDFVVIGFESGEIIKCDLTLTIASRLSGLLNHQPHKPPAMHVNGSALLCKDVKISHGIGVELYRFHKCSILEIGFIQNSGDMASIDQNLNISVWKNSTEYLYRNEWFIPFRKLRMNGAEVVMTPKGEEKVIFEDEVTMKKHTKGKKKRAKTLIEQERKEAQSEIRTLKLATRKPWYSDDNRIDGKKQNRKDAKFLKKTYAPLADEIFDPVADQLFYSITKQRSTNLLVKFSSSVYSVSYHHSKALIGLEKSVDGKKWYFMFLFGKHEPNIKAHITYVSLDLTEFDTLQSMVIKQFMEQSEFDELMKSRQVAFTVTRNYQTPDSEYIFSLRGGRMKMLSAFTASEVGWCLTNKSKKESPPEYGLQLPAKLASIKGKHKLSVLCRDGKVTHVFLLHQPASKRSEAVTSMFTLSSISSHDQNSRLRRLKSELKENEKEISIKDKGNCPFEQSVSFEKHSARDMPVEIYMKMMLNSMIDNSVAIATGQRMTKEQRTKLWNKDWNKWQRYFSV